MRSSSSGLRRSRFHNPIANTNNDHHDLLQQVVRPPTNVNHSPLSLTEFTKASHKRLLILQQERNNDNEQEEEEAAAIGIVKAASSIDTKRNSTESKKHEREATMDQCIALLEPHLAAFRERCDAVSKLKLKLHDKSEHHGKDDSEDTSSLYEDDEVPSQLIRLARFFVWRWLPIKKALLRCPPQPANNDDIERQEVEVGLSHRIRLARACWKRGLLAGAEYESLSASFSRKRAAASAGGGNDDDGIDGNHGVKRYKSDNKNNYYLMERVRLSLMRLPSEVVTNEKATLAWRHVHEVVMEFCKSKTTTSTNNDDDDDDAAGSSNGNNDDDNDGSIEQVADWMLTSWTAFVLSQSMDDASSPSTLPAIERQFASLLSNTDEATAISSPVVPISRAVTTRIDDLLSPKNLKDLNGIHLFSLGKLLARYHSSQMAEEHIAKSICKCATLGGNTGLEQLSRLVATYICSLRGIIVGEERNNATIIADDRITGFEKRISSEINSAIGNSGDDLKMDKGRIQSFLNVVLSAAAHLCLPSQMLTK